NRLCGAAAQFRPRCRSLPAAWHRAADLHRRAASSVQECPAMTDTALSKSPTSIRGVLLGRRGRGRFDLTDILTYGFLVLGLLVMFTPVAWVVLSSFKTQANLQEFPPTVLPYASETVVVAGFDSPLPLFDVTQDDGSIVRLAQVRRVGLNAQMVDPADPEAKRVVVPVANAVA